MSLKDVLSGDIKIAMKEKDVLTRDSLRVVVSEIVSEENRLTEELRENTRKLAVKQYREDNHIPSLSDVDIKSIIGVINVEPVLLSDDEVQKIIAKSIKNLKTIGDEAAMAEIALLETYLPKQLDIDELTFIIKDIVSQTGANSVRDTGKVMAYFVKMYGGQADGKTISGVIKNILQ